MESAVHDNRVEDMLPCSYIIGGRMEMSNEILKSLNVRQTREDRNLQLFGQPFKGVVYRGIYCGHVYSLVIESVLV